MTDSLSSYKTYANKNGVSLVQIKIGKFKEGIYHIQNINALHSNLRSWIQKFKGVSTMYLANYLYWFKWLEFFKSEKRALKSKLLLIHAHFKPQCQNQRFSRKGANIHLKIIEKL